MTNKRFVLDESVNRGGYELDKDLMKGLEGAVRSMRDHLSIQYIYEILKILTIEGSIIPSTKSDFLIVPSALADNDPEGTAKMVAEMKNPSNQSGGTWDGDEPADKEAANDTGGTIEEAEEEKPAPRKRGRPPKAATA